MKSRRAGVVAAVVLGTASLLLASLPGAGAAGSVSFNPLVQTWVNNVNQSELETWIRDLSGEQPAMIGGSPYTITTRSSSSGVPIDKAEQYVYEKLSSFGLDSVTYQSYPGKGTVSGGRNIIGQITGTTKPNEIVVVSGHLDNRPWDGVAYGADDDASGVAAMLYAAKSMAGKSFARTIRFVAFGNEENAPWTSSSFGSGYYASQSKLAGENIVAMINADGIGYNSGTKAYMVTRTTSKDPGGKEKAIATMWQDAVATYGITGVTPTLQASGTNISDHGAFWKYHPTTPAVMMIQNDDAGMQNPCWHATCDRVANMTWPFYLAMVRSHVALAAHQAQIISTS